MGESSTVDRIEAAIARLPAGELDEASVQRHLAPLFARVLARNAARIYLANHSLGRPLDAMDDDVREALAAWYRDLGGAWNAWGEALAGHRARLAQLIGAPRADCIVPKTSAGAGLRAVLSAFDRKLRVVSTRGEFDSLDVILREYARRGRIDLALVEPDADESFDAGAIAAAVTPGTDLVVVSEVMFKTGQRIDVAPIVRRARAVGARVLLDVYHSVGVVPVDVTADDVDFAVGGSYKYLRGGPGACFLYVSPSQLAAGLVPLDTGWFAKEDPFDYARPDPPRFAAGGDGWMESTPPVLTWFQARAGQAFTLGVSVARLRAYSLTCQRVLVERLAAHGIAARGGDEARGAFVVVRDARAVALAGRLSERGVDVDARGDWLRLCPDVLTTTDELARVADALHEALRA